MFKTWSPIDLLVLSAAVPSADDVLLPAAAVWRPLNLDVIELREDRELTPAVIAQPVQDWDSATVLDELVKSFSVTQYKQRH